MNILTNFWETNDDGSIKFESIQNIFQKIPAWFYERGQGMWGVLLYSIIVLSITFILSFFIGYEREKNGYAAGLRTHILVGLGSCLFMIISRYGFLDMADTGEPGRIAAQVIAGIGFIGAGVIMKNGLEIKGLTTAATLWIVAAIGMCAGDGLVFEAIFVSILAFLVLVVLKKAERKFRKDTYYIAYIVPSDQLSLAQLTHYCDDLNIQIKDIDVSKDMEGTVKCTKIIATIKTKNRTDVIELIEQINHGINPLRIEELK